MIRISYVGGGLSQSQDVLDQVIGAQDVARLRVLDHPVREPGDVTRRLKHRRRGHDGGVELEHALLDDKVLAPFRDDVRLQRGAWRAIVVEPSGT